MIETMTRGYETSTREARTSPVPLLFMPSPYISETRSAWSTLKRRLYPYPEAKAVKQRPVVMANVTTKKSKSRSATAWGSEIDPFE